VIRKIEVNTAHFKGNFPDTCSLEICQATSGGSEAFLAAPHVWRELLPQTKLQADHRHIFSDLRDVRPATHVRFHIYPDGGVSRLRLFGHALRSLDLEKGLRRFNKMPSTIAYAALMDCSGSKRWATQMQARRPFRDVPALFAASEEIWPQLTDGEWLAAFAHHPAIGGKSAAKGQSTAAKRWSKGEQAVAQTAAAAALEALACANEEYRDKFGYVFLICATGKTSDEILAALRHRIHNDPAVELRTAAEEQRKITRIRLEKLLAS
jgi:allantoicase